MELKLSEIFAMRRKLFCYTLAVMAGIVLLLQCPFLQEPKTLPHGDTIIKGIITEIEQKDENYWHITIDTEEGKVLANCYQHIASPWSLIGREISFSGTLTIPSEAGNPRAFDYRQYLLARGIHYTCTIDAFSISAEETVPYCRIKRIILEKRELYMQNLAISTEAEGVLRGLLFGDKTHMDEDVYEAFRKNGTAHVLAVSGLHVGILYGIYRRLRERWKSRCLTGTFLAFLFLYGTTALWSVSVTRAIGLIFLVVLGGTVDRRYDLLTALSAVALISMIKNPYVIFGAGFQMSFLAVLSIVFLQIPFRKVVGEKWAAAFAVQVGLFPYMAYTFNYVSFVGILCNVPVIFLASILVPLGMAGFVGYLLFGFMMPGISLVLNGVTSLMIWCNHLFSAEGILSFDVISPPLWLVILVYCAMFFVSSEYFHIYFCRKEWKRVLAALFCIFVATVAGFVADLTPFDKAELVFVDVGQGDCLHVKTPDGRQVLVDGGGKFGYNTGEKTLKPYLLKNRIGEIDLAVATHLHLDHFAGLEELSACYPVKKMKTEGRAGQKIVLEDDYWLEILWPKVQHPDTEDENQNSLIFMVHHGGLKTLVTGDITAEGEAMLLDAYRGTDKLEADILKIAHHGSPYSTSDAFLKAVHPKVAVISVGKNNYGHPSEIIIEKLRENGIMVFRTDLDGAVGIINRKGNLSVCTEKQR